ncbi:MAG: protein translocase subunit SecF [Rubricoccaceae bacterium]
MRILENTHIDFLGKRKIGYIVSGVALVVSLIALVYPGLEAGIDFRGGTEFVVETDQPIAPEVATSVIDDGLGAVGTEVKEYGNANTLLVRTPDTGEPGDGVDTESLQQGVESALANAAPGANPRVSGGVAISPRFADDLQRGALYAVFGALFVILLYIFVRFDWRYAVGAVLCLTHDIIIVLGVFALFHVLTPVTMQLNQTLIAALLTIVGYSINDTVVVYDRIREFANLFKTEAFDKVANKAINSTLSRTLLTSGTTLITVGILFLIGGEVLHGFALALLIGIGVGTYSSIFVASPLVVWFRERYAPARRAVSAR